MKQFNNDIDALVYIIGEHLQPSKSPLLGVVGSTKIYTYERPKVFIPWGIKEGASVVPFNKKQNIIVNSEEIACATLNNVIESEKDYQL